MGGFFLYNDNTLKLYLWNTFALKVPTESSNWNWKDNFNLQQDLGNFGCLNLSGNPSWEAA